MKQERKVKIISLVAIIVAVIGLTIAFAAMSRTLRINGSSNVDPANFEIYFTNLSSPSIKGEATTTGTPSLETKGAEISNINVTLKQPNDSVTYTVDIKNDGDIDAEIENLVLPTFTNAQQELFDFTVVYTNGGQAVSIGDTLAKKETKNVTITFKYKDITDESLLPSTAQQISLSYQIIYKQTNKEVLASGSGGQNSGQNSGSQYGNEIISKEIASGIFATYYGGTPMAKSETGIVQMSNDNRVADDVRYTGGTLVISGTGAISAYDNDEYVIQMFLAGVSSMEGLMTLYDESTQTLSFKYNPTSVVIEGLSVIGQEYFSFLSSVTSITLHEGLETIEEYAFSNKYTPKPALTEITLPSTVTSIESLAFCDQESLSNIVLNEGLETISDSAFAGVGATTFNIPSTVTSIGGTVFSSSSIEEIYIASENITFSPAAFSEMYNLNSIYVKTQAVKDSININNNGILNKVIIDPTKF